ncbi:MAG: phosphate transport system regulatory protein PhoU [Gammaproteobacteria bacterium]|nr:MAG: phosphate transport system regulatory protein PhoU [Gammaproteobacteria bacterium]RLA17390.1 MAG: phosphate transport system regulatory protein PhoU [Gammaproteobacteria bacterium]
MKNIPGQHISRQFDADLEHLRSQVLAMGGVVEEQIADALEAFINADFELAEKVALRDHEVNAMEVALDEECSRILALRQPAAGDLRLIFAIIKTITDLERIGDQAERVVKPVIRHGADNFISEHYPAIRNLGNLVKLMLHDTLDAFARMDPDEALKIHAGDREVDREYEAITRQLVTVMMEDARNVRGCLSVMFAARALERIGDHSKNINEYLVYMVHGKDIRHLDSSLKA